MTNEQIKSNLLKLEANVSDFSVIMSGKQSKKVNGLYKPQTHEIILHNRNFSNDNQLMFTAIHEFAHHLQFTSTQKPISARVHTAQFWDIFHSLLNKAEELGLYQNLSLSHPDFMNLTERIKNQFIRPHGELIKAFGEVLLEAHSLCEKHKVNFIDYVQRVLKLTQNQALSLIKLSQTDINPAVGYENMKTLLRIRDEKQRKEAEKELLGQASPFMIKMQYQTKKEEPDPLKALMTEKKRLERQIDNLQKRLQEIKQKLASLEEKNAASPAQLAALTKRKS